MMQPHFACAWAWAGNTPFQWGKQVASHLGRYPEPDGRLLAGEDQGQGRPASQFTHVIDVAPTILEAIGIPQPTQVDGIEQMPVHGTSFVYTFADAAARERHTQQYFEMFGNRAMYKDGWLACCRLDRIPWKLSPEVLSRFAPGKWDPEKDRWELLQLDVDFSQAEDVAAEHPDKLRQLQTLFWQDAEKYQVMPMLGGFAPFFGLTPHSAERTHFTFYPGTENIGAGMIPRIYNRSFTITADLEIPEAGAEGVLVAESDVMGGFSLYVMDGKLRYTYSFLGIRGQDLDSFRKTAGWQSPGAR